VLAVGGVRVQVDSDGSGPPFVLVHSLLTGPEAFAAIVPTLATRFTVLRPSLPGFGDSEPLAAADPSISDLADHLAVTLDTFGCGRDTTILGNGLGGFVAAALAVRHGGRYGNLILSNSGAAFSEERATAFGHMSRLVEEGGMGAVVDVAVRRVFPARYLEANPQVIEERRRVLEEVDPRAFAAACRALARLDLRPELRGITNRTLVVAGVEDATTPPEMARELADGIPGARLEELAECGHCPQLQRPDALLAALESFAAGR
jgi:pimeloyl-ACP methyl ester carboxylesterase